MVEEALLCDENDIWCGWTNFDGLILCDLIIYLKYLPGFVNQEAASRSPFPLFAPRNLLTLWSRLWTQSRTLDSKARYCIHRCNWTDTCKYVQRKQFKISKVLYTCKVINTEIRKDLANSHSYRRGKYVRWSVCGNPQGIVITWKVDKWPYLIVALVYFSNIGLSL